MSYVRVKGFNDVACHIDGPERVWEPVTCLVTDPETGEEYEEETGEGEWVDGDGSRVRIHMVGDDHTFIVDSVDCMPLNLEDFCGGCGQIGCGHGSVRDT